MNERFKSHFDCSSLKSARSLARSLAWSVSSPFTRPFAYFVDLLVPSVLLSDCKLVSHRTTMTTTTTTTTTTDRRPITQRANGIKIKKANSIGNKPSRRPLGQDIHNMAITIIKRF